MTVTWDSWINARRMDLTVESHGHELEFVERVLRNVNGLDPRWVGYQVGIVDRNGRSRRIDFVIDDGAMDRPVAIEVDGRDKAGRLPTHSEHDDFATRQNAVTRTHNLIRVTNNQVAHDAAGVRRDIEESLAQERARYLQTRRAPSSVPAQRTRPPVADRRAGPTNPQRAWRPLGPGQTVPAVAPAATPTPKSTSHGRVRLAIGGVVIAIVAAVAMAGRSDPVPKEGGVASDGFRSCPSGYPVKANIPESGNLKPGVKGIYHVRGQQYYDETDPEWCFATPADASAHDFRPSKR